ncbi:MAG: hypothetical protein QOI32_508, partial [Thermoleophilaceae bacterium]|nr:hypothetical protein [Thermoleophilaceae bacterium]
FGKNRGKVKRPGGPVALAPAQTTQPTG